LNQIPWFFVVLLLIGMLIHLGLGVYSRRFKIQPVQLPFEILMYFCVIWTVTFALDISSDSLAFKILLMKIRFLGLPFVSLSLMLIAILFSGHGKWLTKRRMAILLIIPIITVFLALTTEYSTVFRYNYALVQTAGGFSVLGFANGIWTRSIYFPFIYIEEAITLLLLLQVIFGNQRLYARQAQLFFVAVLIPVIADILFLFGITPVKNYNIVPSTFAFTGILLAIALFQYRFIDIVPVARNTLFERMSDPMLVIDREGRLADFNPAAEKVLGLCRAKNLGKGAIDVLHEHEELCACIQEPHPACRTITIEDGAAAHVFDLSIEKLASGAGELTEKLVLLRDVTDYRRMEKVEVQHNSQIQMLLELHLRANESQESIMDYVIEAILKTTQSGYSWLGLLDEAMSVMTIHRWSRDAMAECAIIDKPIQYPIVEAGLWGECIRQRKPLLINDYDEPHPGKKGIPTGHVPIHRLLVIPVFDEGRIVAAAAVANKQEAYTKADQDALTSLVHKMWEIRKRKHAEEALQVSEEKFKKAFFTSPDSVSINRLSDGMFVSINRGFSQISGYTEEETVGKTSLEINIWKNPEDRRNIVEELLAKGEVRDYEVSFLTKKGEIDGLMFASIIEINGVPHILNITRDITERKKAEEALQKSEVKYHTLYNNMQEGVALHELVYDDMGQAVEYKIVDVNSKFESILNMARDVVINKLSTQAYDTSLPPYLSQYSAVAQSGIPQHFETYFSPLNKHLEISVSPWGSNGFATIFSDITKRKQAEEERMRSEREKSIQNEIARVLLTTSDDDMYGAVLQVVLKILDSRLGVFAYIDEDGAAVAPSMLGEVMEQCNIPGKSIRFPREDWGDNIWTRAVLQKKSFIKNEPGMVPQGHLPIDNVMVVPILYHDRVIAHFEVANKNGGYTEADKDELEKIAQFISPVLNARLERDIKETKREHAELALRETKDYLDKLIAYANAPIIVWDSDWRVTRVNMAFERLTGYNAAEFLGNDLGRLFPEEHRWDSYQRIESAMQGEFLESVEIPILNKSGEVRVVLWNSANIYAESGELQATIAQGQDITERKRAEDELALYARRLLIINRMDRVVTSSLDIEQVYDRFVQDLRDLVPIDRTSVVLLDDSREHWTVAMIWTGYEPIIGKGEWRDVKGSAIEWLVNQKLPLIENEIGEKGEWAESEPLRQEKIRSRVLLPLIIRDKVVGVLSLASRLAGAYSEKDLEILTPLSDQFSLAMQNSRLYDQLKQQSLQLEKAVEERTAQLQKANQELEAFSYSVSHDLRSPLRAVDGFSRILLEEHHAELSPDAQHYLGLVRSNAVQMGHLIDDLLAFSRTSRQPLAKRLVNPAEIVEQVLEELHGELQGRNVEVIVSDLPHCQADPAMMKRVFFNLISNAVKFTRKKDEVHIDIGSINNEGMTAYFVKDNGIGFDMNYSGKLFGVFSRLHSESDYEGTGVGLALVQRIVHRHGGRVWAEAEVDKGATFYFTLEGGESL
jgi:PAS domain S-box-containing protein